MAKLQRKSAKLFAENASADIGGVAQFGSLAAGNPNYSKDPDTIQALNAFKNGWSSAVVGNKSPTIEDRNALDYLLSYQQAYIMQRGMPEWIATETYYKGSFVSLDDGRIFVSKIDNNTNIDPDSDDGTNWIAFPTPAELESLQTQINTKADSTTVSGKADKNLSNIDNTGGAAATALNTAGIRTVIEESSGQDGSGKAYRVWSDKFCEQWGVATDPYYTTPCQVTFKKPFRANSMYWIQTTPVTIGFLTYDHNVYGAVWDPQNTGFKTYTDQSISVFWYACGYID